MSPKPRLPTPRPALAMTTGHHQSDRRAETSLDRARGRARHALRLRIVLLATAALLWGVAVALLFAAVPPGWAALCATPALLITLGLSTARILERRFVVVTVYGLSMEPAYHDGDQVVVRRRAIPVPGSVVVVERPPFQSLWPDPPVSPTASPHVIYERQWVIKRVAAVPGDAVPRATVPILADPPQPVVPQGMLVLLGDNAEQSYDSRHVGYFPTTRILGAVVSRR